jgi:hypothetical protein
MTTFFTIFLLLVLVNVALLVFSIAASDRNSTKIPKDLSGAAQNKIYPLDLSSSDYQKAI